MQTLEPRELDSGVAPRDGTSLLVPLIAVTSLFFLWGLSYGLLDVLNKHFQETLHVGRRDSAWLQAAYFGAYFVASFPAGAMLQRWGYKAGMVVGLLLYSAGAFLFMPAALRASFAGFVGALFVLACGLSCLETAANPYITVLGPANSSERRLNLSQSFNGLGSFLGPLIGGALFFSSSAALPPDPATALGSVARIYAAIGVFVLVVALVFWRVQFPELRVESTSPASEARLRDRPHFVLGVVAQLMYVAAQVGVGAFFINFATEHWHGLTSQGGAYLLSLAMLCFLLGRFITTGMMVRFAPAQILSTYGALCTGLALLVSAGFERLSVLALITLFFFMSIMFPTIFSLGLKDLGPITKRGAPLMVAAIVGGAFLPYAMGALAERTSTATVTGNS